MVQNKKLEKSRGQEGNIAQKPPSNQISESVPKLEFIWSESQKVSDKRIRQSTLEIRRTLVQIKSDLRHVQNFHYILLE